MNTKPSLRLINDGKHANSEYLAALMTWPNDFSRGNLFTEASIKNLAANDCRAEKATIFGDRKKEVDKVLWPGFVTGSIFFTTLRGLSLGKSKYLAVKTMDGCEFNGNVKWLSHSAVRMHWSTYKSVAHLWAAYAIFVETKQKPESNLLVQYAQILREMSLAQGGIKGCDLLVVETDIGRLNRQIIIPPISSDEQKILDYYEPRSKF